MSNDNDINIKVGIDDSDVYRKLSNLRESIQKIKDQLTIDVRPPSKGGLSKADFEKTYGFAKTAHKNYIKELDDLDAKYAAQQNSSIVSNLVSAHYEAAAKTKAIKDKQAKDSEKSVLSEQNFRQKQELLGQQHTQRITEENLKFENRLNLSAAKSKQNINETNAKADARININAEQSKNRITEEGVKYRNRLNIDGSRAQAKQEEIITRVQGQAYIINLRQRFKEEERLRRESLREQQRQQATFFNTNSRFGAIENALSAPSVRYAFYDIAQNARVVAQEVYNIAAVAVKTAADYESAFTDVERTTLGTVEQLGSVKGQLVAISEQVPIAFGQLSKIASIGAQLGLSTSDVAGFAKTVSEFSAASNVSAESAATAFGTIGELFNVAAGDYDKLGSAIAYVGVNSTATESQIISVTEAIAGVTAAAGFSSKSAIGLAGALASLKVPAEQSRGALTRIFQEVSRSASGTEEDMQGFANVLGVTTGEARQLASTDMETFFMKFITGLQGMDITTLTGTLDALNLSDVRVANTLSRLAGNIDVVNSALSDSSKAYEDGTFLSQVYALRVDDLNSKMQILTNDLQNMMSELGEAVTPVLGSLIDFLSQVAERLTDALSTDAGKAFAGTATIILGVVGAMASLLGVAASVAATMSVTTFTLNKLKTAFQTKAVATVVDTSATQANTNANSANAVAIGADTTSVRANTTAREASAAAAAQSTVATEAEAAAFTTAGVAAEGASVGMRAFKLALIGIPIVGVITLLAELAAALGQASESADIQFQNFVSNTSGLSAALGADKKAYDEAVASGNKEVADSYIAVSREVTSNMAATDEQLSAAKDTADFLNSDLIPALNDYSDALGDNTNYIGENTRNWLKAQLTKSEDFQKFVQDNPAFVEAFQKIGANFDDYLNAAAKDGQDGINKYFGNLINQMVANKNITVQEAYSIANELGIAFGAISSVVGGAMPGSSGSKSGFANTGRTWISNSAAVTNAASEAASQFNKINLGFINQTKIMASESGNATEATGNLTDGLGALGDAAGGAAQKIYLLTDYASDLANIWERARDIRFSGTETFDKITSSLRKIAKATEDARQQITELNADIQELQADQALQQYFLSVAEAYGDTLKAQEIRANLAKIDSDLTKKTKDLQKAQDKTNKTLVGNSEAAIENRGEILDLVSTYQDHVKALAASGVKQDELRAKTAQLKQDFIAQATQLGYNVDELGMYAVAFDDVAAAIDNVPRNVTVDFNGDPALTAIQEFAAKSRDAIAGAGGSVPITADTTKAVRAMELLQQYQLLYARWAGLSPSEREGRNALNLQMMAIKSKLASGEYATGGYVSGPGTGTSDSISARLSNGEYVIRAAAVQKYGVGFFDGLNQMRSPQYYSGGAVGGGSTVAMVSLSPEDRALLRNVGGSGEVVLYANNEAIARSANAGNKAIVAAGGRP